MNTQGRLKLILDILILANSSFIGKVDTYYSLRKVQIPGYETTGYNTSEKYL